MTIKAIAELQDAWEQQTFQKINRRALERLFYEFWAIEFTVADLNCVLAYMKAKNAQMQGAAFAFRVHLVIGDLERFASMLAEAQAVARNRKVTTPRQAALAALRPSVGEPEASGKVVDLKAALRKAVDLI